MAIKVDGEIFETEKIIQERCVKWFRETYPQYMIFGTFNEHLKKQWRRVEPMGACTGAPDLTVILPNRVVFIEMKTPKGAVSSKQREFGAMANYLCNNYFICRSLVDFQRVIWKELVK